MLFTLDSTRTTLVFSETAQDSITICFRTVSPMINQAIFNRDVAKYNAGYYKERTSLSQRTNLTEDKIFSFGSLYTAGAITRGVTFGNRQNVFVNSALNLQMEGDLSEDLKVSAVITDQNIPYQPEGNTQQIRDFDNVFIKLFNEDFEVIAGDIVLQNPVEEAYFLKYYKNVQGLGLKYNYSLKNSWKGASQASGSLAKGQFTSAVIQPQKGVQGPYKLRGGNGERFIIIMANSERVYLDGELLERGFDRDYVIDYNLGEITFSNGIVITRFSRIRVDYEYANQYYSRSNITATQELSNDRTKVYFNYYREKDNPNVTLGFDLDQKDREELIVSGDNNGVVRISGVDSTGFIENAVLYARKDILVNGIQQVYYQYTGNPDEGLFQISFSDVGAGNGTYGLLNSTSNGRIYEYLGDGQGNYLPVQIIPTPNQKQMFVSGVHSKLTDFETIYGEVAFSGQDQNLYSNLDDDDNFGLGTKVGIKSTGRTIDFMPEYRFQGSLSYEFDNEQFTFIDRFRSIDFNRDWSYDVFADSLASREDQILVAEAGIVKDQRNLIQSAFRHRNRADVIQGDQIDFKLQQHLGPFQLSSINYFMRNDPSTFSSRWVRSSTQLQLSDWFVRPGYRFALDEHQRMTSDIDSITSTLMNYQLHNPFIETGDSSKIGMRFDYINRIDKIPQLGEMVDYTHAEEFKFGLQSKRLKQHDFSAQLNYRVVEELLEDSPKEKNLLGRLNWSGFFADRHINNQVTFTTANARELKREFVFLQVATGEGTHTWRDENEDDIQDLNEFYEAVNQDEKNYIKLFTPTDEYINAYQTTYIHSLDMRLPDGWEDEGFILATLSKLSLNTNLKFNFKTTSENTNDRLNPFEVDLEDEAVVSARNLIRNTLFFNRNAPGIGFDISRTTQGIKSLLSSGYEIREKNDWIGNYRISFGREFTIRGGLEKGSTLNQSDFLDTRNFDLMRSGINNEVVWQPSNSFRFIAGIDRRVKTADQVGEEKSSQIMDYNMDITWIRSSKGNLNAAFSWIEIDFSGERNTYLGYELLEALQPGTNQKWNVNWQQSLGMGLQLSLQYYGRKSEMSKAIHSGSISVTAYF